MNGIYVLLGSNMGNRLEYLKAAEEHLIEHNIQILDESSVYETAPWGKENQQWFLNVVLQVDTSLDPVKLLQTILVIEQSLGRVREEKWGERCIDIDILYYHDEVIDQPDLSVPHPGIPDRRFTLIPLAEMCPMEIHPILSKNHLELLADCTDTLDCRLTDHKL